MSPALRLLTVPRLAEAALIAISLAALGIALLAQHVGGLPPCELCIWQRWAYAAAIGVLLPGLLMGDGRQGAHAAILALGGVAFLAGTGISIFHAGVEQGWWQGLAGCSASFDSTGSAEDMLAQILAAPVARCNEIPWSMLGLSIAGWNAVATALFAASAFTAAWALMRSRRTC